MIGRERRRAVGVVSLERPERRNALTSAMLGRLAEAIDDLGREARCLVLRGEGSVFCAGFDLASCRESTDGSEMRRLLTGLDLVVRRMRACPCPVVAACRGAAIAGGCALVAGADFAVADRGAKLGYPVVVLGVSPAVSVPILSARVGTGPARVRTLDPGLVRGEEALRIGLVSDLVAEPGEVDGAAVALAERLAAKGAGAMRATKAWLNELDQAEGEERGLATSLGLAGGQEEQDLLRAFWSARGAGRE